MASDPATHQGNVGHGHVFPRPDGAKARCGGPAMCRECALDEARKNRIATQGQQAQYAKLNRDNALLEDFRAVLNRNSREGASNTPDYILAEYLVSCLEAFEEAHNASIRWWGSNPSFGVYVAKPDEDNPNTAQAWREAMGNRQIVVMPEPEDVAYEPGTYQPGKDNV